VLERTVEDVDVNELGWPFTVVTRVITSCDVELPIKAEVIVVFDVLLLLFVVGEELVGVLEGVVEGVLVGVVVVKVVSLVEVEVSVTVVGVLFEVVVLVDVMVDEVVLVRVVLDGAAEALAESLVGSAVVTPVPPCLLWNMPSMMGFPVACTVATSASNDSVSRAEKCIVKNEVFCVCKCVIVRVAAEVQPICLC
jgi:hypothetical protein